MSIVSKQNILFNLRLPDDIIKYILDFAPNHRDKYKMVLKNLLWFEIHYDMFERSCDNCNDSLEQFQTRYKFRNYIPPDLPICNVLCFCSNNCKWSFMESYRRFKVRI
jgi:hypothetical protein